MTIEEETGLFGFLEERNDAASPIQKSLGKTIAALHAGDERLCLTFTDRTQLELFDHGFLCCEKRYMRTEDDLTPHYGSTFQGVEEREGPTGWGGEDHRKECVFLIVTTSRGQFTIANYNEHNGYYGGFALAARLVKSTL